MSPQHNAVGERESTRASRMTRLRHATAAFCGLAIAGAGGALIGGHPAAAAATIPTTTSSFGSSVSSTIAAASTYATSAVARTGGS